MKFKGTVALTAVFIGIVLYYFLVDTPNAKRKQEQKVLSEKVIPFDTKDVKTISIVKGESSVALRRSGIEEWFMTEPVQAKGDSPAVSGFLSFLNNLNFSRVVEESPKNLSTFGLSTPKLKVILTMDNGETKGIRVGDDHPMGNRVYLARLNEKKVLTADIIGNRLDRNTHDLRDKTILNFEAPQIKKIELIDGMKTLVIKKNEGSWQLVEGENTLKGSENEITNFLNTIRAAHIERFVEEKPEQLSSYGLNNSKLTLKLTESKTKAPLTLLIGGENKRGFYAKTLSGENVFVINQAFYDTLNNSQFEDFIDKSLVDFNDNDLSGIALRTNSGIVDLIRDKKDSQKWTIVKPVKTQVNKATINSLLFDLKDTRIVEFIEIPVKNPQAFGLERPKKEITLTYTNGKTWSLALGNQTSNADNYSRTGEDAIFTLKNNSVETIFRSLHDLRDRTLFELSNDVVKEIQIHDSKQAFILKKSKNKWDLVLPESVDSVQSFVGKDILWTLNSIEFESVLSKDPGNAVTGVTNPQVSLKLLDQKGMVLTQMVIGKALAKSPKLYYLKVVKKPAVYIIKKRFLDEILSNLNRLKDMLQPD